MRRIDLKFDPELIPKLLDGSKTATTRLGEKAVDPGDTFHIGGRIFRVMEVSYGKASTMCEQWFIQEAYPSPEDMRGALRGYYPDITDDSWMTSIRFAEMPAMVQTVPMWIVQRIAEKRSTRIVAFGTDISISFKDMDTDFPEAGIIVGHRGLTASTTECLVDVTAKYSEETGRLTLAGIDETNSEIMEVVIDEGAIDSAEPITEAVE